MIRAKDVVVLVGLAWWLLRDREEVSVGLTQTCVYPDGYTEQVPLEVSECPYSPEHGVGEFDYGNAYSVEPLETNSGLGGVCGSGCACANCG